MVDATGAGDSFDAGFLAAWLAGEPVADALALACACGALSTRAPGGTDAQPTLDEAQGGARMILCVAANPSIDRLFTVERLVPGSIHRPAEFAQVPGGKGLNVARAATALGGDVIAAALLGGHAGRWIAEQLEAEGVPLRAAWADAETRSSLSVAGAIEGLTEFYEHGHPGHGRASGRRSPSSSPSLAAGGGVDDPLGLAAGRARRPTATCGWSARARVALDTPRRRDRRRARRSSS